MLGLKTYKFVLFLAALVTCFSGCGESESQVSPNDNTNIVANGKIFQLRAYSPLTYQLNPASPDDPNTLIPGMNPLQTFQYDAVVPSDLDSSKKFATTIVTGMGIDIVDLSGKPLKVSLIVEARQYDGSTGFFGSDTEIYSSEPGLDIQRAQNFVILNKNSPNYVYTGLALKMRNARVTNLVLQKKTFANLNRAGRAIEAGTYVSLPPGWAMVGFALRASPHEGGSAIPFIQDIAMYIAELTAQ